MSSRALTFALATLTTHHAALAQWTTPAVTAPRVQYRTFFSPSASTTVSFHVYTPPQYDTQPTRRFPVLYWLHGSGSATAGIAPMADWFNNAITQGLLQPLIVVFPNGMPLGMWNNSKNGSTPIEDVLILDLIPHADATFRTRPERAARLIEGFSMGGYGSARLALKHHHLFAAASALGAGPMQADFLDAPPCASIPLAQRLAIFDAVFGNDPAYFFSVSPINIAQQNAPILRDGRLRFRLAVGAADCMLADNIDFFAHLQTLGIPHTTATPPGVGHQTLSLLTALGPANWTFYEDALGPEIACVADLDGIDGVDLADFFAFLNAFDQSLPPADVDGIPGIDLSDFFTFFTAFDAAC